MHDVARLPSCVEHRPAQPVTLLSSVIYLPHSRSIAIRLSHICGRCSSKAVLRSVSNEFEYVVARSRRALQGRCTEALKMSSVARSDM